ncbi:putative bifunctional diguanylate cyclase/phosphodiesterase [Thiomicrorhabdus indica]|uniref:putative bifunctional diguanylate cyclase/phosphodiesterase n=1 Tax=Thiomicrorhabdus indica TaxID=2267253 RepID=UPI002AA817E9|nr:EAL domain-containing protein [Thiomicrorhabdus indica]
MRRLFQTRNWSLRTRLLILISSLSLLFMFLTILLVDIQSLEKEKQVLNQKNNLVHQFLLSNYTQILLVGDPDSALDLIEKISKRTDLKAMILTDMDGNTRFRYGEMPSDKSKGSFYQSNSFIGGDYVLNAKVNNVSQEIGEAVYFYQGEPFIQRLINNLKTDLLLLPFLVLVSLFVAHRASQSFIKPLEQLADQMSRPDAESGHLVLPVEQQNQDVQRLYRGFNRLQNRILESMEALQAELLEKAYLASHDSLTGVLNRAGFDEKLHQTLEELRQRPSMSLSVSSSVFAYLDLDQFKLINDTVGHPAGDVYLKQLAEWMTEWLPDGGIIGRLGGDEFGIWLPDSQKATLQLQSLIELIKRRHFSWNGQIFHVGASIGMVEVEHSDSQLTYLYQCGDVACYTAKALGRNRLERFDSDNYHILEQKNDTFVLNQVRAALSDGEEYFELWAQAIVPLQEELQNGLLHYEVLLRLRDDNGALVSPGLFLPVAERYEEILHIDTWVFWHYLEQVSSNPEHLSQLGFVDINVTGMSLVHPDFHALVQRAFNTFDFPWHKLKFEITETSAVINFEQADVFVALCRSKGVQIALDDFGSGMASFDYLKRLSFDTIKIDGVFIKSILDDPFDESIVKFMIEVAEIKSQTVVAEFVENEEITQRLKSIGMQYAQGYHFDKPKPLSEWLS